MRQWRHELRVYWPIGWVAYTLWSSARTALRASSSHENWTNAYLKSKLDVTFTSKTVQNYTQCSPFMYGDADDGSVAVEDTFDVFLRQNESVEVSDEDSRIDWSWIARVCHVTDLAHRTQKQ